MTDLSKLSARKLQELIAKRQADDRKSLDAAIGAGMGHMRGSDIRELAKGSSLLGKVLLARRRVETGDLLNEAYIELDARMRYSGTDKPIKRAAS